MKARGPSVAKQNRFLSKTKKKTTSSMACSKESPLSKLQTFSGTQQQDGKQDHDTDSDRERHHDLSEIWPSTEPFSPSVTPTSCMNGPKLSTMNSSVLDTQQDSVLARYVDRFRHGQPQSREERQQMASTNREEQLPFWWASSSSMPPSSTPEKTNKEHRFPHHNRNPSPCRGSFSNFFSQSELVDSEILQLQERASRLLQKGEFCLGEESIPVSSDGLGCSDFSSPMSADEPVRRPMIPSLLKYNVAKHSVTPSVILTLAPPKRPEEDILFQWRLKRKMEKAKEWTQSQQHCNPQCYSQSQPLPSENPFMPPQRIYPLDLSRETTHSQITAPYLTSIDQQPRTTTTSTTNTTMVASNALASSPQALAHVPSHMHLLCDILPCPNQSSHPNVEERASQRPDSQSTILPQTKSNSEIKCTSPAELHRTGSKEKNVCLHYTKSTEALMKVKGRIKQPKENEKNIPILCKEQKKSSRVYSLQRVSKNITTSTEQHQQIYSDIDSNIKSTASAAPPPSPIHGAVGQVVSEVLFPSVDSSPTPRIPPASPSPSCSVSAPPQYSGLDSIGVISQLLQEAEDSDEKEFEDDPLLHVLRKQRKWVKEQMIEVDTLLKEFPDEQHKL